MASFDAKYKNGNGEYEISFYTRKYREAKAVERVCRAIIDKRVDVVGSGCAVSKTVQRRCSDIDFEIASETGFANLFTYDGGIQAGDLLILNEWDGNKYTGRSLEVTVKFVMRDMPEYGLKDGRCFIGCQKEEK